MTCPRAMLVLFASAFAVGFALADTPATAPSTDVVPDASSVGGESRSIVRVGNLVYAGTKTSRCFSDHFLKRAAAETTISTSNQLHPIELGSEQVFDYPLLVMSGEGPFELSDGERDHLRRYIENGGLLLASAGCSSPEWDRSFRAEMSRIFPNAPLADLAMSHPLFHTAYEIGELRTKHGTPRPLRGIHRNGRLGVIYSFDGLNDTANTQGCCCCGGNELTNAEQINVNILAYALTR